MIGQPATGPIGSWGSYLVTGSGSPLGGAARPSAAPATVYSDSRRCRSRIDPGSCEGGSGPRPSQRTHTRASSAASALQCVEFVASLPQGYETIVGERGI